MKKRILPLLAMLVIASAGCSNKSKMPAKENSSTGSKASNKKITSTKNAASKETDSKMSSTETTSAKKVKPKPIYKPNPLTHRLWYKRPAQNWQMQALPIGNGKLGAMVFGKVERERFMFNEDSLWIGDEEDTGSYQGFGDVFVQMHPKSFGIEYTSPSHGMGGGEGVMKAFDKNPKSKWCMEHKDKDVVCVIEVTGEATPLTRYSLFSANDVPARDPSNWVLEGSTDGETWETLDKHEDVPSWPKRRFEKTFEIENTTSWPYYRFVFEYSKKVPHFQVADIRHDVKPTQEQQTFSDYRRELNLSDAIHRTKYKYNDVQYTREAFSSAPHGVMVFRFEADKPAMHTGEIELVDRHDAEVIATSDTLSVSDNLKGYKYPNTKRLENGGYKIALDYEAQVKVLHEGGRISAQNGKIRFEECDSITVLLGAGTDYINQRDKGWKGEHPHARITSLLKAASATPYSELKNAHIKEHQSYYRRFEVTLPSGENSKLPTDQRLEAYKNFRDEDRALEALQLHYARYLMIASSRPGSLPANLQGIWNESINPPWRCDYHSDVNLQMNYWFVDQTNLSECFAPYADYQYSVRGVRIERTKKMFGVRGWGTRSENGIFGGTTYLWVPGDAAWLAQNIWDHYAYTLDKEYLKNKAYPILKELCEFWEDSLLVKEGGVLVSPASVSPEHGPKMEGNSYEQQLVYDLFTNFIEASTALDTDAQYREKIREMRGRLLKPQIGRWGQLQEWMEDRDDPKNQHRHLSHLIAVYPGRQIAPSITPKLAKAAKVSLAARGDSGTGWSIGWKICLWARLLDGNHAHKILEASLKPCKLTHIVMNYAGGTYHNLLMAHPPFQIEANFGYAAGFCEMLMQSHLNEVHLLPALPSVWPNGKVKGLKARGGFVVDIEWRNGRLASCTVKSLMGSPLNLRYGKSKITLETKVGESYRFNSALVLQ